MCISVYDILCYMTPSKCLNVHSSSWQLIIFTNFSVKEDVNSADEEGVKVKEQAVLQLGSLLAQTGQAEGKHIYISHLICRAPSKG